MWPLQDLLDKAEANWNRIVRFRQLLTEDVREARNYKEASRKIKLALSPAEDYEILAKESLDHLARLKMEWIQETKPKERGE